MEEDEKVIIATAANYWIASGALNIQLNALGEPNRIQASVASGAEIMVYIRGVKAADPSDPATEKNGDGLEYDVAHNYRHWPLRISPTYFNSNTEKYLYVAIPRKASVGTEAMVVFPSEKLDIYGYNLIETEHQEVDGDGNVITVTEVEQGTQVGSDDYWYIWLQGIISDSGNGDTLRTWQQPCETGYLNSDEAYSTTETEWYKWDPISQTVTFLKEIWMDAASIFMNLKAKDVTITGLLDAIRAKIDDIRSHNYEPGLLDGSGFRLTSDNGEGGSELEVDFLKVRKKATFMELEIRKETFVGGNQNYSPAGSVIYRVDYMDEHDEALGYSVMKVPFLLKGLAFIGHMFGYSYNYAARKRVRHQLDPADWPNVHHFRCYLLADDGTTATRNWWRAGDQARCQSFNKAQSASAKQTWDAGGASREDPATPMAEKDYSGQPIETAYYWRLISNTGSEKLDDGYIYDFVDMPYEGWYGYDEHDKASFRDGGSGIPVAGDTIVCMGNRTEKDRMNMVSIQTTGDDNDPPALKGYRGIHSFRMEEQNRVFCISPKEFLVRSQIFRLLDDSGYEFPVPLERGEWQKGLRYHWYDRVSWKGSIWLCVVLDDYIWEDANGRAYSANDVTDIEVGEGSFAYTAVLDGETYTGYDHYYERGKVGSTVVYYIRIYTYSEPSKTNNLWQREVSKGTEITGTEVSYAASMSGTEHPSDDSEAWKVVGGGHYATADAAIAATGIDDPEHKNGVYLWTRKRTFYDDVDNPDRPPLVEYTVVRWGIDADGIYSINSYYLARNNANPITAETDNFPMPGDPGWDQAAAQAKWFDTWSDCALASQGVGRMQGWLVWEKTVIIYDQHFNADGTEDTKPDIVTYKSSRIGQDGQIGEEEYYMLAASDDFNTVFGSATPSYNKIGIRWYNQNNPAAENWRLSEATQQQPNINTQMWSTKMPTYDLTTHGNKIYLWNFEQRVDGKGTEYATRPICIGNHARGIVGVQEFYALSTMGAAESGRFYPSDIKDTGSAYKKDWWTDEIYDRAPEETLPYQWNKTVTIYNDSYGTKGGVRKKASEWTDRQGVVWDESSCDVHYHVSSVKGTAGEDGTGIEYIYILKDAETWSSEWTLPKDVSRGQVGGQGAWIDKDRQYSTDDYVPEDWSDNPLGVSYEHQYEFVSERRSTASPPGFMSTHFWTEFSTPVLRSKWGKNGKDGDGTEYVFIRTKNDTPPVLLANDGGTKAQYESMEWRPYVNARADIDLNDYKTEGTTKYPRCTDDPKGTSRDWPYEWVAKRTMAAADDKTGTRVWKSYYESVGSPYKLSKWSTYSSLRLDIDNEMDMVPTESDGTVKAAYTVSTVVHLYDGATEIDLSGTTISFSGGPAATIATASQASEGTGKKGRKLSWAFIAGQTMADAYEITISYTYNNVTYTAVFTIAASKGQRIYRLSPLYSSLNCPRNANNTLDNPPALSLAISRIDGDKTTVIANPTANATYKDGDVTLTVKYNTQSMPTSASSGLDWPKANSLQVDAGGTVTNVYFALFNSSGTLLDRETVPVIRDGINGKSITKVSETYSYGVNESETTPPSVDGTEATAVLNKWYSTRAKVSPLWTQGRWLWVKTYITWSDDSHTTLYTNERNPNDGVKGQDIIVDGSTEMKYYVGDSNTTHPAEDSSDWKDISQVTQTKGKWLWSKATTWYRKAGSAAGSKDAGKSVNYNVSYIAKDGDPGRAVTKITEYYKANNSSSALPKPTSDSGWSTDPNLSDLTDKWDRNHRYLWNYEKVEYSSGTTVERTVPQILAIWTEDGAAGTGIDSIVNWYKITTSATPPSKPSTPGTDGWDDDPTAPGKGEYLWNYEVITWINPSNTTETDVQLIGYVGEDAVVYEIDCDDIIKPGDTALNVWVIRTDGDSSVRKTLAAAYTDWELTLEVSKSNITKAELNTQYYLIVLSGVTASSKVTLTLKKGSDVKDTVVVHGVADGDAGHVGRWYYYAGEWDANTDYLFEKTRAPFVLYDNNYYMLDCGSSDEPWKSRQQSDSTYTSRNETPAGNGKPWSQMQSTFKYIITEAIFTDYAHLSAFVFNGDWMISTNGTIQGIAYNSSDWKNPAKKNGKPAYEWFDPSNPNSGNGFIPNFAIDGLTGKTYMNAAYVKGQIVATSGDIKGPMSVSGSITIGATTANKSNIQMFDLKINNVSYGAVIEGRKVNSDGVTDTRLYRLGYNQEFATAAEGIKVVHDAALTFGSLNGNNTFITKSLMRVSDTAANYGQIEIYNNHFCIYSTIWPSYNQAKKGEVYVGSSGSLYVRLD